MHYTHSFIYTFSPSYTLGTIYMHLSHLTTLSSIHIYTYLYTSIYPYIPLYTPIYPYTPLYAPIHPYTPLYTPIHPYTIDIRKAYKKLALKYHPDKNPQTTPLFQMIHQACERLCDKDERAKAQFTAERAAATSGARPPSFRPGNPPSRPFNSSASPPTHHPTHHQPPGYHQPHHPPPRYNDAAFAAKHGMSKPGMSKPAGNSYYEDMEKEKARKAAMEADALRRSREAAARHHEQARRAKYQGMIPCSYTHIRDKCLS